MPRRWLIPLPGPILLYFSIFPPLLQENLPFEKSNIKPWKDRLKGAYVRSGDADQPMTEYEIYSYEAFRRKY